MRSRKLLQLLPAGMLAAAFGLTASAALPLRPGSALGYGASTAGIPIVDRPEIRSFQRFERGVRTTRPRIILPRRLLEEEAFSAGDYTYCADAPSDIEPREGPYAAAPIPMPYCP